MFDSSNNNNKLAKIEGIEWTHPDLKANYVSDKSLLRIFLILIIDH